MPLANLPAQVFVVVVFTKTFIIVFSSMLWKVRNYWMGGYYKESTNFHKNRIFININGSWDHFRVIAIPS